MNPAFEDHFSSDPGGYARARPGYPPELFTWIRVQCAPPRRTAWDCACGSAQAARGLAGAFERVIASDASAGQLAAGGSAGGVQRVVALAEASPLATGSVDVVVVAQAVHWFDLDRFHAELRRVLRPGGLYAEWSYGRCQVDAAVDAIVDPFHDVTLTDWWPAGRRHVLDGYAHLAFPFSLLPAPAFAMEVHWTRTELLDYLGTWSSVQRCLAATGKDPRREIAPALRGAWPEERNRRKVTWPLGFRAGRRLPRGS